MAQTLAQFIDEIAVEANGAEERFSTFHQVFLNAVTTRIAYEIWNVTVAYERGCFRWQPGDMAKTTVGSHGSDARLEIHEVVRQLNTHLGPTLVAALSGTTDRNLPIRWAKADGPTPGTDYQRRLKAGHRVWTRIGGGESDHVARSWFIGANPLLEEDTPITAIREDRTKAVVAAADAFLEDQPAT